MSAASAVPDRSSIRLRIVGPAALIALPLMALAGWRAWDRQKAEVRALESEAREQVAVADAELEGQFASVQALLSGVARLVDPTGPRAESDALLREFLSSGSLRVANLWLADSTGHVTSVARSSASAEASLQRDLSSVLTTTLRHRRATLGDPIRASEIPGAPWALTVAVPLPGRDSVHPRGVLGATVLSDSLTAMAVIRRLPAGSVLTVQDSTGRIIWRSLDADNWVGRSFANAQGFLDVRLTGQGVDVTRSADGTVRQVAYRVMPASGWIVYVGIPDALTRQIVRSQLQFDLLFVLLATLGLLGVAWYVADRVAAPIVADALAREAAERALTESRDQLRQAQKLDALGSFAGGIAHDFNNYLTSIIGFAEMALEDLPADHPVRGDLRHLLATADKAAQLTRQVLVFSRRSPVEPQPVDVALVVRELEPLLIPLLGDQVRLVIDAAEGAGSIRADRGQLEQVLVNLATNARDAMPDGGTLTMIVTRERHADPDAKDHVRITVRDTGVGMTDSVRERIFEPFFTTKDAGRGTGLGLAIAYSMVQQAHGDITVASAPGRGTTFALRFARLEVGRESASPIPLAADDEPHLGAHILVTEDDHYVRRMTTQQLTRAGYRVTEAADGEAALAILEMGQSVDLLLTDVVMPGLHGRALLERVWAAAPGLPVLVMSAHPDDDLLVRDVRQADVPFLAKPFGSERLLAKVRQVLSATRAAR